MTCNNTGTELLARKILLHSRRRITHMAPILLECIYALPEKVRPTPGPLSTDGAAVWFHPGQVVEDFRKDRDYVARQLLHVTVHCLLGHLELRNEFEHKRRFDLAADLKAAQFIREVCGNNFDTITGKEHEHFFPDCPHFRPLYQLFTDGSPYLHTYARAGKEARLDEHALWTSSAQTVNGADSGDQGENDDENRTKNSAQGNTPTENCPQAPPDWNAIRQSILSGGSGKLPGTSAGMLNECFSVPERGMSYEAFLRRFAAPTERMLLDPDSFDIRWYHLGLENYGNIPLLEPSELSEPPMPDDLVIALDTSGSCCGEVCKRFLKETLGILRDIAAGVSRFRVLLLQCDTKIQQEVLLESSQQVDELFENFHALGFGGTDFRPVFERVEQLRGDGTLPRVRGLLYLTDGCGDFPPAPTDYPTVFLIPEEEITYWNEENNWITRLYLNEHDFTLKEANDL